MEPPGTYSRKMLKCSFVRSVPWSHVNLGVAWRHPSYPVVQQTVHSTV